MSARTISLFLINSEIYPLYMEFKKVSNQVVLGNSGDAHTAFKRSIQLIITLLGFSFFSSAQLCAQDDFTILRANYGPEEGLPVKRIDKLLEDQDGFIWMLADEGLVRFDGYDFQLFSFTDINCRANQYNDFLIDPQNRIWLVAEQPNQRFDVGNRVPITIDIYDPSVNRAQSIMEVLQDDKFEDFRIKTIYQLDSAHLGITLRNGETWSYADRLNLAFRNSSYTRYNSFHKTSDGSRWLISDWDIIRINKSGELVEQVRSPGKILSVQNIREYPGLLLQTKRYRPGQAVLYVKEPDSALVSSLKVNDYQLDLQNYNELTWTGKNRIALATFSGVDLFDGNDGSQQQFFFEYPPQRTSKPVNLFYHSRGSLWFSYQNYHLGTVRLKKKFFRKFLFQDGGLDVRGMVALNDSMVSVNAGTGNLLVNIFTQEYVSVSDSLQFFQGTGLIKDDSLLYSAAEGGGIIKIDLENGLQRKIVPNIASGICELEFIYPFIDRRNRFWWGSSCGLVLFNQYTEEADFFPIIFNRKVAVNKIIESEEMLYLGTSEGLYRSNDDATVFEKIEAIPAIEITDIFVDNHEDWWIGTRNTGLINWNRTNKELTYYTVEEGLQSNGVSKIMKGIDDNLWISTQNGLCCLNPNKGKINLFFENDGLANNEFNESSGVQMPDGSIILGGPSGLSIIPPLRMSRFTEQKPSGLVLSGIEKLDFQTGRYVEVPQSKARERQLELNSGEKIIRISYSGLDFKIPRRTNYVYKFSKGAQEWLSTSENKVYYQNIPFGKSTVYIKRKGQEDEEALNLQVFRATPIYRTWGFIALMVLILGAVVTFFWRWRIWKMEKDRQFLMNEVERKTLEVARDKQTILQQNKQLKEINRLKDRIFQIVGHEFRDTINSYEELSSTINFWIKRGDSKKITEIANYMERSSTHLSFLVDNLISWGRLDGQIPHQPQLINMSRISARAKSSVDLHLQNKNIALAYTADSDPLLYVDPNIVHITLRNILNNAIKYSFRNSKIELTLLDCENEVGLMVRDYGVGIEEERLKILMEESMESTQGTNGEKGMGIGMLLCKRLVHLDGGYLEVNSKRGEGTSVKLLYPRPQENQ